MHYEASLDKKGNFAYAEFTHLVRRGGKDKEGSLAAPSLSVAQVPPQSIPPSVYQLYIMAMVLPMRG